MDFDPPLTEAIILKRYKRFLADINLNDETITVHVPNTGSMESCWEPDWKCAVSKSPKPDRKLPYTLELTHNSQTWIGVNTANANRIVKEALINGQIPELAGYKSVIPEKKIGDSRVDFYLEVHPSNQNCYVEVKSVTLKLNGLAQFPDAVSTRGQKHLKELIQIRKTGLRSVIFFLIQREDVSLFTPAKSIDPIYSDLLKEACMSGVEILVYGCKIDTKGIRLNNKIPWEL